jgi:hypothetical protein
LAIILFIEAETVHSGIKATVFLWKIFFSFFFLQRGNFGNKKVKGEIHKMGKGLKRKHAPPPKKNKIKQKTKENSKSIRMYKKGIFTECCLCLSRI